MQPLPEFLIHASTGMALFYIFFRVTLRTNTHFKSNRIFLITALLLTLAIALWPVRYEISVPFTETAPIVTHTVQPIPESQNISTIDLPKKMATQQSNMPFWLIFYLAGIIFFSLRLLAQVIKPLRLRLTQKSAKTDGIRLINTRAYEEPFSLFNCIFLDTNRYNKSDLDAIIAHEKVHIQERHWIDLLIIETLTVIFWFNPFIWLFERAIKENHEFLADAGVISRGHTLVRYQALLVNQLMGMQVIALSNNLNFALGPNRLNMMKKEKSPKRKLFRIALLLPVIAGLLYAFAEPEYVMETQQKTNTSTETNNKRPKDEIANFFGKELKAEKNIKGKVLDNKTKEPLANVKISVTGLEATTYSDNNGEFTMKLPKGFNRKTQYFILEHKDYQRAGHSSAHMSSKDTTTIEVTQYMTRIIPGTELTISGKIIDEKDIPKQDVKLLLFGYNNKIIRATKSNTKGEFKFQTVAEDNYGTIATVADGYLSADKKIDLAYTNQEPLTIKLEKKEDINLDEKLSKDKLTPITNNKNGIVLNGTVVDERNQPVIGANIIELNADGRMQAGTIAKADGTFTLKLKPKTKENHCIISVGFIGFEKQTLEIDLTNNTPLTIKLKPNNDKIISGKVFDENGKPINFADITEYDEQNIPINSTTSNVNGNYIITLKRPDIGLITVGALGYITQQFSYKASKKALQKVVLKADKKAKIITGKIVDENGNVLSKVNVVEVDKNGRFSEGTITAPDGNFVINPKQKEGYTELKFSYIGYKTISKQINLSDTKALNIQMERSAIAININEFSQKTAPPPPPPAVETKKKSKQQHSNDPKTIGPIFMVVERMPSYEGGYYELNQFIKNTAKAKKENFFFDGLNPKGKEAVVGFTVAASGKATNITIIEENDASKALVKIIEEMPAWQPGEQRGKKVPVDYVMKYTFE